jgi:hypothetical protein
MKTTSKFGSLALLAALIGGGRVHAQDFSIDFGLAGGGGGSSFGGDFELSATIGQPEAGDMIAGDFAIIAGFWNIVTTFETPGAPSLSVSLAGDSIIISWPDNGSAGFVLEETPALADSSRPWMPVDALPEVSDGVKTVHLRLAPGNHFYRLHKP